MAKKIEIGIMIIVFIFSLWLILAYNILVKQGYFQKEICNNVCNMKNNLTIERYIFNNTNNLLDEEIKRLESGYYNEGKFTFTNKT